MGTRGLIGFRSEGKDFLAYNHFDSYAKGLGVAMLKYARDADIHVLRQRADSLSLINLDSVPGIRLLKKAWPFIESDAESPEALLASRLHGEKIRWYDVLRNTQGSLDPWVQGMPVWPDYSGFQYCSSCEWMYLLNFDEQTFELYTGHWTPPGTACSYRKTMPPKGRYAVPPAGSDETQGVLLLEAIPLSQLKGLSDKAIERFCARIDAMF